MRMPFRLNPHRSRRLPAVSFFEGFQTPAGLEKTRAHLCGRHLKPITKNREDFENYIRTYANGLYRAPALIYLRKLDLLTNPNVPRF